MSTYVSLLKGINVGGHKIIKMTALKSLYERLGFEQVKTYIQSGNVIFKSNETNLSKLEHEIEKEILLDFGFGVSVQVIPSNDLISAHRQNPFLEKGVDDFTKLCVTFLNDPQDTNSFCTIIIDPESGEEYAVKGKVIYLFFPNGYGQAVHINSWFETKFNTKATTRNWKTVCKLVELVSTYNDYNN